MELLRWCKSCGRELATSNPGSLCVICQDKIIGKFDDSPFYDVADLKHILGLESEEHVRRIGRAGKIPGRLPGKKHHYSKSEVDHWIKSNHKYTNPNRMPSGPFQEEAYRLCQSGDHNWLTDERFLGQACTAEPSSKIENNLLKISTKFKCYFCGFETLQPFR